MKIELPGQQVHIETPTGLDPIWFEKLQQIAATLNRGMVGQGRLATTATTGFAFLPTCLGAPTGVPVNPPAGYVASIYDATNNRLYIYNGAWRSVLLS